jgi:sterol desaturase/sphingolipid hydroxylase (fatty acid hydroxylase superfamily)
MNYYNFMSGGMTPSHLLAALSFAACGWFVYKAVTAATRKKSSKRTPVKWDWKFWIQDNWLEALQHMIITFMLVRFASEILAKSGVSPELIESNDPMWIYFVVGLAKSWLLDYWKKRKG